MSKNWWDKGTKNPHIPTDKERKPQRNKLKAVATFNVVREHIVAYGTYGVERYHEYYLDHRVVKHGTYVGRYALVASYSTKEEAEAMKKLLSASDPDLVPGVE